MDVITATLVVVLSACVTLYFLLRKPRRRLPPCAPGIPFVGHLLSFIPGSYDKYVDVLKLGHLYTLKLGLTNFVVLNSYEAVSEAFVGQPDVFSGRQQGAFIELLTHNAGVVSTDGPMWQEHRRFILRLMREFGLGRPIVADLVADECEALKETLDATQGTPVQAQEVFNSVTNNVIARLIFGERSGTDDKKFMEFSEDLNDVVKLKVADIFGFTFSWILTTPIVRDVFHYFSGTLYHYRRMDDYMREKINNQRQLLASMDPPPSEVSQATNICEAFLIEQAKQEKASPGGHTFTEWQLIGNMIDLFAAGTETTATTLNWAMLLLSVYPDVQKRVQSEIEEKIGRERPPTMNDRLQLPYVCAVMDEVMRYSSLVPQNLIHRVTRDTTLMGYDLPADTLIQSNLYGIHHDPKLWSHPSDFHPEHFLTGDGEYHPSKYLIPFSLGKRACLGESLARMEYFLAFVTLMQTFEVGLAPTKTDVKAILGGTMAVIRHPLHHQIIFKRLEN